jgi:hypothetical protein
MRQWTWGLALGLALAVPTVATAQSAVGVRAGMRWSELEAGSGAGSISSLALGGYYGFGISDRLAVQIEAVYGSRGGDALRLGDGSLDSGADPVRLEMTYFEVPLLLRAGFPGERLLPSVFAGPYVGFLLNCEVTPTDGDGRSCDQADAGQRFSPRSTEFGMAIGVALDVLIGESTIYVDGRYTLGLRPIQTGDEAFDARHTGLALTAGVAVPVGR